MLISMIHRVRQLLSVLLACALLGGQSIAGMHGVFHVGHTESHAPLPDSKHADEWLGHSLGDHACAVIDELAAGGLIPSAIQLPMPVYGGVALTAPTRAIAASPRLAWFIARAPPKGTPTLHYPIISMIPSMP